MRENHWAAHDVAGTPGPRGVASQLLAIVLLLAAAASCRHAETRKVRARIIEGAELPLVISRLEGEPRRFLAPGRELTVRFAADPEIVELSRVESFSLWLRRGGSDWERVGTSPAGERTLPFEAPEGISGLRASVIYREGREDLAPAPSDRPTVLLLVDTTAPVIRWRRPAGGAVVRIPASRLDRPSLELEWEADEPEFGGRKLLVEWSGDEGESWTEVAELPATSGAGRYRWRLPRGLAAAVRSEAGTGAREVLLRLRARDAVGHPAEARLAFALAAAPSRGEPAGEDDAGGGGIEVASLDLPAGDGEVADPGEPFAGPRLPGDIEPPWDDEDTARDLVRFAPLPGCIAGGAARKISWEVLDDSLDGGSDVVLEVRRDGEAEWRFVTTARLGDGEATWQTPAVGSATYRLRLVVLRIAASGKGALEEGVADSGEEDLIVLHRAPVEIDGLPPAVQLERLPEILGADAGLSVSFEDDGGCSSRPDLRVFLRQKGEEFWDEVPSARLRLATSSEDEAKKGTLDASLDLGSLEEGRYEIYLAGADELGNVAPAPGPDSAPAGRFELDRTPPRLEARFPVLAWVGGFQGEVLLDLDPADCVPPLVIEGRRPGEDWKELRSLQSLALPRKTAGFPVPPGSGEFEVRVSVRDKAGNRGEAALEPRPVESPFRLGGGDGRSGFEAGARLLEGTRERIGWTLHPVAREYEDRLRVSIDHRAGDKADWEAVKADLSAREVCYWEVPPAGPYPREHWLRARLLRDGEVIGEDLAGPFEIFSLEGEGRPPVEISEASLDTVNKAGVAFARFRESITGGDVEGSFEELARNAEELYRKALALDSRNHHATFGLAQLYQFMDAREHREEAVRWLESTLSIVPDHALALNDLGTVYLEDGDYGRAQGFLERSVAAGPSDRAHYNLGLAHLYQKRPAEARKHFAEALARIGEGGVPEGDVRYYTIYSYLLEGRSDVARRLYAETKGRIDEELRSSLDALLGE